MESVVVAFYASKVQIYLFKYEHPLDLDTVKSTNKPDVKDNIL